MFVNTRRITIEWGDCDPAGIVFFPRYLAYFDACTWALFTAALGRRKRELLAHYGTVGCPMVDLRTRFLIPSTYGDEVVVETQVRTFRRSSFEVQHRLLKEGVLAVEGVETRVWAAADPDRPGRLKALPVPDEVIASLGGDPLQRQPVGHQP